MEDQHHVCANQSKLYTSRHPTSTFIIVMTVLIIIIYLFDFFYKLNVLNSFYKKYFYFIKIVNFQWLALRLATITPTNDLKLLHKCNYKCHLMWYW